MPIIIMRTPRRRMKLYKLTNQNGKTFGGTQWGVGVMHSTSGKGPMCSKGWIYAYTGPLLAVLLDPIHGDFGPTALLWESEGEVGITDHGLKVGCTMLTTLRRIPLVVVSMEQR